MNAGDFLAGHSLPLPGIPKVPSRVSPLSLQSTQSVKWLSREPVVPTGGLFPEPTPPGARAGGRSAWALLLPCLGAPRSGCAEDDEPFSLGAGGDGPTTAACEPDFGVRPPGPTRATGTTKTWLRPRCCHGAKWLQPPVAVEGAQAAQSRADTSLQAGSPPGLACHCLGGPGSEGSGAAAAPPLPPPQGAPQPGHGGAEVRREEHTPEGRRGARGGQEETWRLPARDTAASHRSLGAGAAGGEICDLQWRGQPGTARGGSPLGKGTAVTQG